MSSVKVAVRVRPFSRRELDQDSDRVVSVRGRKVLLFHPNTSKDDPSNARAFTYDFSYWSFDRDDRYASQDEVFSDLGQLVLESAFDGYNACVFAYGQTGAGKTFCMMGNPGSEEAAGLTPRICKGIFERASTAATPVDVGVSCKAEVSYMEIYNEKVRDLMLPEGSKAAAGSNLKVREHPETGPYVENLSKHLVKDVTDILGLIETGNTRRTTAATLMNDVSSRSHAVFTINFTQASWDQGGTPRETSSKINLVDLAGSERVESSGASGDRLREGSNINKSLSTLGLVISALAHQSLSFQKRDSSEPKPPFIPYRDSVLTWLLKDSLGGNSKTIMLAAVSPASICYSETLTTLRYANRAKNIVNKPTVNEDPMARLIRELRAEILQLKTKLTERSHSSERYLQTRLHQNEALVLTLTNQWEEKWQRAQNIMQTKGLTLSDVGATVRVDTEKPYLVAIDSDPLSASVTMCYLKEGVSRIGSGEDADDLEIVIDGEEILDFHCSIHVTGGEIFLVPEPEAFCSVDSVKVETKTKLHQGSIVKLGINRVFRLTHPIQAAKMRQIFTEGGAPIRPVRSSPLAHLKGWKVRRSLETEIDDDLKVLQQDKKAMDQLQEYSDQQIAGPAQSLKDQRTGHIGKIKRKIKEDQRRLNVQKTRLKEMQRELGEDTSDMSGEMTWKSSSASSIDSRHKEPVSSDKRKSKWVDDVRRDSAAQIKIEIDQTEQRLEADKETLKILNEQQVSVEVTGESSTAPSKVIRYQQETEKGNAHTEVIYSDNAGSSWLVVNQSSSPEKPRANSLPLPSSPSPRTARRRLKNVKRTVLEILHRPTEGRKYQVLSDKQCDIFERNVEESGKPLLNGSDAPIVALEKEEDRDEGGKGKKILVQQQRQGDDDDDEVKPRPPLSWFCCYCF